MIQPSDISARRIRHKPANTFPAASCLSAAILLMSSSLCFAQPVTIHVDNFTFTPVETTVAPGTTITWVNDDDIPHTVVATDGTFKSKALDTEDQFTVTMTEPGEYVYFCSLHPRMTGKIIVKAP